MCMDDLPDPGSPEDWLRYVRSDLALASMDPTPDVLLESLCYHSQQTVEKALKALLVRFLIRPPRTHDIKLLLGVVRKTTMPRPPIGDAEAETLTGYSVLARYPTDLGEVETDEWVASVEVARAVASRAEALVGQR